MSEKKNLFAFLHFKKGAPKAYTEQLENGVSVIRFNFAKQTPDNIDEINHFLLSRRFSHLEIEDPKSFLSKETRFDPATHDVNEIIYRCGINSLTLKGECEAGKETFCYQLGTAAFSKDEMSSHAFNMMWRTVHPGYVIRVLTQISYNDGDAFVYIYHART